MEGKVFRTLVLSGRFICSKRHPSRDWSRIMQLVPTYPLLVCVCKASAGYVLISLCTRGRDSLCSLPKASAWRHCSLWCSPALKASAGHVFVFIPAEEGFGLAAESPVHALMAGAGSVHSQRLRPEGTIVNIIRNPYINVYLYLS